jgi:probable F420-dependent oxidoreductase
MSTPATAPQLSIALSSFSAEDPGGWSRLRAQVLVAESVGLDRVVVSDHVAYGEHLEAYSDPAVGGTAGGRQPTGPDGHWLEPFTVLAWASGFTERIRLGTNIMIAALRRPVVLAKELATLDVLSGGRVDLGVGVGWQREEYEAAGLDFESRGALLDHTLSVCRTLWTEQRADHDDEFLQFEAIHQMPKPLQPGGVPRWVSGTVNPRMLRRLARFGSGWIPWGPAAADPVTHVPLVKAALAELGREDLDQLQIVGTLPVVRDGDRTDLDATMAATAPLVAAGITDLRVRWSGAGDPDADAEHLDALVQAVRAAF